MFDQDIIQKIAEKFLVNNQTIAVAESVTAGLLQNALSSAKDATCFFQGGTTAYNLEQKNRHFHIDEQHALSCNCVSERVAAEMAVGVVKSFDADWGIGITGYASPVPEKGIENLFACFAIAYRSAVVFTKTVKMTNDKPLNIQLRYVDALLLDLLELLHSKSYPNAE